MRFFTSLEGKLSEISFNDFAGLVPEEAAVLEGALDLDAEFELDQNRRLGLRSTFSGAISLKPANELEYHKRFFHKNSVYTQPLAKALGLKKGKSKPRVFDATAGTLKDTCLIVSMGLEVLASERHPVAQALIINSLKHEPVPGLEFLPIDACELVKERGDFDVIYFDPMYEQKNEKAAPRKEMRIFREVIQSDLDAGDVAQAFRESGKRLVVKRSAKASPLIEGPSMSFGKKSTIYDVYL